MGPMSSGSSRDPVEESAASSSRSVTIINPTLESHLLELLGKETSKLRSSNDSAAFEIVRPRSNQRLPMAAGRHPGTKDLA